MGIWDSLYVAWTPLVHPTVSHADGHNLQSPSRDIPMCHRSMSHRTMATDGQYWYIPQCTMLQISIPTFHPALYEWSTSTSTESHDEELSAQHQIKTMNNIIRYTRSIQCVYDKVYNGSAMNHALSSFWSTCYAKYINTRAKHQCMLAYVVGCARVSGKPREDLFTHLKCQPAQRFHDM